MHSSSHIQSTLARELDSSTMWGSSTSLNCSKIFSMQKKAVRIIVKTGNKSTRRDLFRKLRLLTAPCIYIQSCLNLVVDKYSELRGSASRESTRFRYVLNWHSLRGNSLRKILIIWECDFLIDFLDRLSVRQGQKNDQRIFDSE